MDPDLLTLPPVAAKAFSTCEPRLAQRFLALHDPVGQPLGSGGGTFHALVHAWTEAGTGESLETWIERRLRTLVHAGGQSRRLPAYAPCGKALMPVPALRGGIAQRLDQTLLDLQVDLLDELATRAGPSARLLLACGDALLRVDEPLPALPDADVVLVGTWVPPEQAAAFGVLVCDAQDPRRLIRFLQKPSPHEVQSIASDEVYFVDTGIWLLSARALSLLGERCGWHADEGRYRQGSCESYELYASWGLHLGARPVRPDAAVQTLTCAVVPLPKARFLHFGTPGDVIESVYTLQQSTSDPLRPGQAGHAVHPRLFTQNALFDGSRLSGSAARIWIENSAINDRWTLAGSHIITGVPDHTWAVTLPDGVCLDVVPLAPDRQVVRVYGWQDAFRGAFGDPGTHWMGAPARRWFEARGLDPERAGAASDDLHDVRLFPELTNIADPGAFITWCCAPPNTTGLRDPVRTAEWLNATRHSAAALARSADLAALYAQRDRFRARILPRLAAHHTRSIFHRLDLASLATDWVRQGLPDPAVDSMRETLPALQGAREAMFRCALARARGADGSMEESRAFERLRGELLRNLDRKRSDPRVQLARDQIVWARSPVRLDLAGGWTDTPPYCIEHGGCVVNLAVDLNGQPPIQVFIRQSPEPHITFRSIDLGIGERLEHFDQLAEYNKRGSGFSIARAALSLAGFHPQFALKHYPTLRAQLEACGGGLEITLLSAVPKGSGLGASSILGATLLAGLSDVAGLGWDRMELLHRTLAMEQLLGSGGGWQDQAGALWPGAKCFETTPGWVQRPAVRYLPGEVFEEDSTRVRFLLYYTGITRVAHDILGEIVRGLFLNEEERIRCLRRIGSHARAMADAIQRKDVDGVAAALHQSWTLNQALDAGTNPPAVQALLDRAGDGVQGAKLTGAGGGGFLLLVARDADAARRIQSRLDEIAASTGARRVDFSLSRTGLCVTRS